MIGSRAPTRVPIPVRGKKSALFGVPSGHRPRRTTPRPSSRSWTEVWGEDRRACSPAPTTQLAQNGRTQKGEPVRSADPGAEPPRHPPQVGDIKTGVAKAQRALHSGQTQRLGLAVEGEARMARAEGQRLRQFQCQSMHPVRTVFLQILRGEKKDTAHPTPGRSRGWRCSRACPWYSNPKRYSESRMDVDEAASPTN